MLIIALPHHASEATTGYAHVHAQGQRVVRQAHGTATPLWAHAGEVVAVVPHSRLSWLSVQLPANSHGNRLTSVLHGLLEDRLLADPAQLHCVAAPSHVEATRQGGHTLVAVCDKNWLRQSLAPLTQAGLHIQRIVPEFSPNAQPSLHVLGTPAQAQCVLQHAQGVTLLPPHTAQWHAFDECQNTTLPLYAEPAMVSRVQETLQRQAQLETASQRWLRATQTDWNLAQGEWGQSQPQRLWRWLQQGWQTLWQAPSWKPVRWGLVSLLAVQLLGLNLLAWREQSTLTQQRTAMQKILQTTFTHVHLVVDAPLQMQRELDALQQKSGLASSTDFEPLLSALGQSLGNGPSPSELHFSNHRLRIKGTSPDPQASLAVQSLGLRWQQQDGDWVLQAQEALP